jgi:1-deoxy-D-xylulose-5-phosphate synthase
MPSGTGLGKLQKEVPQQFYDVGIAEQHAVTFAAGLAAQGLRPICAIYSTFLQRAYDMIAHDVCLQKLPVFFALDRGGIVGADGPTHHGVFDFAYMRHLPHMVIMAPKDENELQHMVHTGVEYTKGPISVRYPRGNGLGVPLDQELRKLPIGKGEVVSGPAASEPVDVTIVGVGAMVPFSVEASRLLAESFSLKVRVVNARFVKPIDEELLAQVLASSRHVVTVEDHVTMGGFGSAVAEWAVMAARKNAHKLTLLGYPDVYIDHASPEQIFAMYGLDAPGIAGRVLHEALGVSLENVLQAKLFNPSIIRLDQLYKRALPAETAKPETSSERSAPVTAIHQ